MFVVHRTYSDENGDSHFQEVQVALPQNSMAGQLSDAIDVKSLIFREVEPGYDWDFHTAPARQYIILLDGEIEIETSLHEKKTFGAGDILLVEDTTGKGHKTKNIKPVKANPYLLHYHNPSLLPCWHVDRFTLRKARSDLT